MQQITSQLNEINEDNLNKMSKKEKLQFIGDFLREIENSFKTFYFEEKYHNMKAQKFESYKLSPIIKRILKDAKIDEHKRTYITREDYLKLFEESERMNLYQDPDYRIIWRRWYEFPPIPEIDETTPVKEAHINVDFKIGGERIDVHLIII